MIHEFPRAMKEGSAFAQRSPRQGTEITERSPWIPLCTLWSHGSAIPSMKGSVNSVLNFLTLIFSGCAALSMVSGEFGRGSCKKRCYKKYVRSCYVYENKQISDKMPGTNSGIYSLVSDIYV
jgi:hypothetical protein